MKPLYQAPLLLLVLGGSTALAQSAEDDAQSAARVHIGPLYLTPVITLQDMGYDSNVFNTKESKESDFAFALTPSFHGGAGSRRAMLTFRTATDFVYFAKHSTERGVNEDLGGSGALNLGRVTLSVRGAYLNTRGRPNEEIDARARRVETTGDANVRVALFPKVAAEAGTQTYTIRYNEDATFHNTLLSETLNRNTLTNYAGVRYALTPITALSFTAEVGEERFVRAPVRDADFTRVFGAIDFNPRARISGVARIGYQQFRPFSSALPGFEGVIAGVDIVYRLQESTRFGVTLDRRPLYSFEPQEPYYLLDGVGLAVRRSLTTAIELEVRGRRSWYRYRAFDGPVARAARTDMWNNTAAAIHYHVNRNLTSTFQVTYWSRGSNVHDYSNLNGIRIGTTMLYRF
jgi:hypothetical protein